MKTPSCPDSADTKSQSKLPDLIAIRKSCMAEGTGLAHFVLMDRQAQVVPPAEATGEPGRRR